jgi:hypothetical protein
VEEDIASIGPDDRAPQRYLAPVSFTAPNGETVSANLGAGRLETIAADDLLKILEETLAEQQKRRRGTPAANSDDEGLHGVSDSPGG